MRLGLRRIIHSGTFSICVVLILSAGIGVAGAMGSVWSALALRPLNLPTPETLVAVAIAATSLVRSLLFGVTATDGATLITSAALLLATALIGAVHPTLRAVRVEPTAALRAE